MTHISSHKDLQVYQKSLDFVEKIYRITHIFPESEKFGLIAQLRRAAISVPSNIAEGAARQFLTYKAYADKAYTGIENKMINSINNKTPTNY